MFVETYKKALCDRHIVQNILFDFFTRAKFAILRRLLSWNGILVQKKLGWRTHTEKLCIASRRPELAVGLRLRGSVEAYVAFSAKPRMYLTQLHLHLLAI